MKNKLRTITAFILLLALVISFVPVAHAASVGELPTDNGNDETSEPSDATTPSAPPDETICADIPGDENTSDPIEVTEPDIVGDTVLLFATSRATSTITVTEKHSFGIGHVDFYFHQNVDGAYYRVGPNWTESACYFTLSNGATAFCVQPSQPAADGEFVDSTWSYLIDTEAQIGIARAMAYGAPNNGDTSEDAIKATALLIADIACGYRKADGTIRSRDAVGNTMYPPFYKNTWGVMAQKYIDILDMMKNHSKIPSFAAPAESMISAANTILLNYNSSTGLYEASITDTNEILADYNFTSNISGLTFTRSGNTLKITATTAAASQIGGGKNFFTRGHYYDVDESAALIWASTKNSSAQKITTLPGKVDPVPAYIRLTLPTGNLAITKTTEDGKNLSGWKFEIYSDATCKNKISGPHESDSKGKISATGLAAGAVWIKEIGHKDATINAHYRCDSTNPQQVTITSGQTASVTFHNKLNVGHAKLIKTTNTGKNLNGWKIGLYYDQECTKPVTGSPFTTGADGTVTVPNLVPGTYYAKEVAPTDPYWVSDSAVKTVTVAPNQTASVTFANTHYGKIQIIKTMDTDGSLADWQFAITDSAGKAISGSPFTSQADGTILTGNLLPGQYTVREIIPEGSLYYCKSENPQTITVTPGQTSKVSFTNALRPGKITIQKADMYGNNLQGAKFLLEWSEDGVTWKPVFYSDKADVLKGGCSNAALVNGTLVTPASGQIEWGNLYPGLYYRVTELEAPEGFILLKDAAFEGTLPIDDLEVSLRVVNAAEFTLPATGSKSLVLMPISLLLCAAVCMGALIILRKKEVK